MQVRSVTVEYCCNYRLPKREEVLDLLTRLFSSRARDRDRLDKTSVFVQGRSKRNASVMGGKALLVEENYVSKLAGARSLAGVDLDGLETPRTSGLLARAVAEPSTDI